MKPLKLGITTFAEVEEHPETKKTISYDKRIRQVVDEIVLADRIGLDFFGVGEHHRKDFAASAPHMILAAAAAKTSQITLSSAVTVLSSEDPVRVYQNFATLHALSNGRAEIMAGRGSFTESFPLFGYKLQDYNQLFEEKLELLCELRDNEIVNWKGKTRSDIDGLGVYPRTEKPVRISVAVGGTRSSVVRAARLGLPLFIAIIGGEPIRFKPLVELYKQKFKEYGHDENNMFVSVHSHGYITDSKEEAIKDYFPSIEPMMSKIGRERGWGPYTYHTYTHAISMDGALFVGDPTYVAKKIQKIQKDLGIDQFALHVPVGYMDHKKVLKTIEYLGTEVREML